MLLEKMEHTKTADSQATYTDLNNNPDGGSHVTYVTVQVVRKADAKAEKHSPYLAYE